MVYAIAGVQTERISWEMRNISSKLFGAILFAAFLPWAMRELRVMGQMTHDGFSFWRVVVGGVDGGDGWFGVLVILIAVIGASLSLAPIAHGTRRYIAVSLAAVGSLFHVFFGTPLFRGTGIWGEWSPGFGFWTIVALFLAAGAAALRQKEEVQK